MAKINLLPWREEQRAEKARQFGMTALFTAIVGAAAVYAGLQFANGKVEHQQARNAYLQTEIDNLVFMASMKQNKDVLAFEGKADSNARVSTLMRNLGASDWFKQPGLELINSQNSDNGISSFKLRLSQSVAKPDEDQQ